MTSLCRKACSLCTCLAVLSIPEFLFAQGQAETPSPAGGWRRVDEPIQSPVPSPPGLPSKLEIKAGTFVTARVDQPVSSDHSQPGEGFSMTLLKPLVVDGVVVAERGQTLAGRFVEAQKAGRVKGVSRLAVQLTEISLVDGQQVPVLTQLVNCSGGTSQGRDLEAVAMSGGMGATIGAMADWGTGAAIGAGAGAAAGLLRVLLTRGRETVLDPESVLTFQLEAPVTVSLERAPQVFRYVERDDYDRPVEVKSRPPSLRHNVGPVYPYYFGPGFVPYYGFPYLYGPSFYYGTGFNFVHGPHHAHH